MTFKSTLSVLGILSVWAVLTSTLRNPNNPPLGNTGAPNETTCAKSGCHLNPGSITGMVAISGLPDTVTPNQTYQITLTNTSTAVRAGFQLTCLDANNMKCGNLVPSTGNNVGNLSNRQYIRQSTPKLLTNGSTSWTFGWTAPATLSAADSIKFYFVSLAANNNGNNGGDNVLKSSKKVILKTTSASHEPDDAALVQLYPNPAAQFVQIKLPTVNEAVLTLYDAAGKVVLQKTLSGDNQLDISALPRGSYLAKILVGGKLVTRQLLVGK